MLWDDQAENPVNQQNITVSFTIVISASHQLVGCQKQHTTFIVIVVITAIFQSSSIPGNEGDFIETQNIIYRRHCHIERVVLIEMNKTYHWMLRGRQSKGLMTFRY